MIQHFEFTENQIKGSYLIKPFIAQDNRGFFVKDFSEDLFLQHNIKHSLKEVFYTESKKGVIRALHLQVAPFAQCKLVRCIKGKVLDVLVDLRPESPTYKQHQFFDLNEHNKHSLYIPDGIGHGYLVLEDAIVSYKCNENFKQECDIGIAYNDSDLNLPWRLDLVDKVILSDKDKNGISLREFEGRFGR
jgi:dTDP-4-dehydrorhamnose 3,5-epimerase